MLVVRGIRDQTTVTTRESVAIGRSLTLPARVNQVVDSTLEVRIGDFDKTLWCGIAAALKNLLFVVLDKERRDCTWACKLAVFFALLLNSDPGAAQQRYQTGQSE
jgi:hypothetical protein